MNRNEEILAVEKQLGLTTGTETDDIIGTLFDDFLAIAQAVCGRDTDDAPAVMLAIVRDTVAGAYLRRGEQGMESTEEGARRVVYEKQLENMVCHLYRAGLRVMKP